MSKVIGGGGYRVHLYIRCTPVPLYAHRNKELHMRNKITTREQSAVRLHIFLDGEVSPSVLYRVAYHGSIEAVEAISDLPAVASRWWRSRKIQEFYTAEKALYDARRDAERKRIEAETIHRIQAEKSGHTDTSGMIDYGVPANQLRKLNQLVNTATDPSEALDALKVIISKQGEIAPEKRETPIRYYRPVTCDRCPLHAMAHEVLQLRASQKYDNLPRIAQEEIDARLREAGRSIVERYVAQLLHKKTI